MIEPIQGPASTVPAEPPVPPRPEAPRRHATPEAPPQPAERPPAPPSDPVLDVQLDGETMRLYTELRDPQTDRVLLRLPAAYEPGEARHEGGASFEA